MTRQTSTSAMATRTTHSNSPSICSSSLPGKDFPNRVAVFSDRFCFTTLTSAEATRTSRDSKGQYVHPTTRRECQLFSLDDQMAYSPFSRDYGPLNLAFTYTACLALHDKMSAKESKTRPICLYTSSDPKTKSNMALMVALYFLIVRHEPPWACFMPLAEFELMSFRDAGNGQFDHGLAIQDCLYGVHKAMEYGLLDLTHFDASEYQHYETPENGDLNILGPFIAFASPIEPTWAKLMQSRRKAIQAALDAKQPTPAFRGVSKSRLSGNYAFKSVLDVFKKQEVGLVVRLNDELYDKRHFTDADMDHVEMYFDDGSNPSDDIIREFINMSDRYIQAGRAVAVHCKAGLGRTGVLIGAYFIYKYGFSAQEVIGFMRIVRPGMVVGPQQQFMLLNQMKWAGWAARDELLRELGQESSQSQTTIDNPLATPPAESSSFSPLDLPPSFSPIQSIPTSPKRGDAIGQPRKTAPVPAGSGRVHIQSPTPEPEDRLARNRQEYNTQGHEDSSHSTRGTKRGLTRKPIPSSTDIPSTPRLGMDLQLERSASILSVVSTNDRPRKRINDQGSPLAVGHGAGNNRSEVSGPGYSSPPPTRHSSPLPFTSTSASDEMIIDQPPTPTISRIQTPTPASRIQTPTRIPNRLRREGSTPKLRTINLDDSGNLPPLPTLIPSALSTPAGRSLLATRKQTPLREIQAGAGSGPSRIPRAVPMGREEKADGKIEGKEGKEGKEKKVGEKTWTPPRLISMFYSMGRSGTSE